MLNSFKKIYITFFFILVFFLDLLLTFVYNKINIYLFTKNSYMVNHDTYHHEIKKNYYGKGHLEEIIKSDKYGLIILNNSSRYKLNNPENIIFMGDSFTQGAGIEYEKTFSGIITSYYKSYSIDVINMSAVSYSPSIHYTKFKYFVENYDLKFDKIFVFLDISDPYDELYRYEVKYKKVVSKKNYKNPFVNSIYEKIEYNLKKFISKNTTVMYFLTNIVYDLIYPKNKSQEEFTNKYGFIINHQANFWTYNDNYYKREGYKGVQLCKDYLINLKKLMKKVNPNAKLTIVIYPWPGQIYRNDNNYLQRKIWGEWSKINNIDFIDLTSVFLPIKKIDEDKRLSIIDTYFLPQDMHFNALGHSKFSKELLKNINK